MTTVDCDPKFGCTITADISTMVPRDLGYPGRFDFILASPPCECFSIANVGTHWEVGPAAYRPKTEAAERAVGLLDHTLFLIRALMPSYWVVENPRGMMRKMPCLKPYPRVTITYCQYGENRMKPTDLFGSFPGYGWYRKPCRNGGPCHDRAPRGAKTGTQGIKGYSNRSLIPHDLSLAMCVAAENALKQ